MERRTFLAAAAGAVAAPVGMAVAGVSAAQAEAPLPPREPWMHAFEEAETLGQLLDQCPADFWENGSLVHEKDDSFLSPPPPRERLESMIKALQPVLVQFFPNRGGSWTLSVLRNPDKLRACRIRYHVAR